MHNKTLMTAILATFLVAATNADDFTPRGQAHAPVPTGHAVGQDNLPVERLTKPENRYHFAGEDCGICHQPSGKGREFSMAGTIYTDRTGRTPLEGAEIILKDASGKVISMTSNAAGNFFTETPFASDPQADASSITNPGAWRYKAWVKKGDYISPMITIAPVGGMSVARMSCNMHHGPGGSRGALNVGGTSTLPSYPTAGLSFKSHVLPILKNRCKSCHVPGSAGGSIIYPTGAQPYFHSGKLDLSAYHKDNHPDTETGITEVVNTGSPDLSPLLTKVVFGGGPHAGGAVWRTTDLDYKAIRQWIAEGAKDN